jgi:hypothetical protein
MMSCLVGSLILMQARLNGQIAGASPNTPVAVARESFDALKHRDVARFVGFFHPDALKRFKAFAADVFKGEKPDEMMGAFRTLFAPFKTPQGVAAASGSELLTAFLKNQLASIPGVDEILAKAELEVLGEVVERRDTVHIITRTVLPQPKPVSCQEYQGRWYLLLDDTMLRMITTFERNEHFAKQRRTWPIQGTFRRFSIKGRSMGLL